MEQWRRGTVRRATTCCHWRLAVARLVAAERLVRRERLAAEGAPEVERELGRR